MSMPNGRRIARCPLRTADRSVSFAVRSTPGQACRYGAQVPLLLPSEERCSFCAYLADERPYTILERGSLTALLVTFEPRGIGHVVAIPIEHRVTILDLRPAEAGAL